MKNTDRLFGLAKADAILVVSEKNRFYFTEFASTFGYLVLFPENKSVFITDPRYYEMAQTLAMDGVEVRQIANGASVGSMLADLLNEKNVKTLGFEDTELTVSDYLSLKEQLEGFELVAVGKYINFVGARCH